MHTFVRREGVVADDWWWFRFRCPSLMATCADGRDDRMSVGCSSQLSPSQLPNLLNVALEGGGDDGAGPLGVYVVSELRRLLCCPVCHRALLDDPTVVDTCGHVFCYHCINHGLEYGCYPVAAETTTTTTTVVKRGDDDGGGGDTMMSSLEEMGGESTTQKRCKSSRGKRSRTKQKIKFTCPICRGPAHKWNLVRVPLFREVVMDAMNHPTLAEALGGCADASDGK